MAAFHTNYNRTFAESADKTALARHSIAIRIRTQDWPDGWTNTVLSGCTAIPSMEEGYNVLAAYELFSETQLTMVGGAVSWITTQSDEVAALRERIRLLELTRTPPSKSDLLAGPSPENITRFRLLPGIPIWMSNALELFENHYPSSPTHSNPLIGGLWTCIVEAYFEAGPNLKATNKFNPTTIRRPAELSLNSLKEQGGRVETEVTEHVTVTWAFLRDKRYFLS